ncbi:MAG TPA: protein kinase [Anaeromyxobacteraceae bacterium]|nr:protein kinase [Anaeromyxobacteraceae bacterium]
MPGGTTVEVHTAPIAVGVGSELGSYELVSLIGEGAMGRVFKARHVKLGRSVAIKVLNAEYSARPDIVKRFFREARVVNEISHEHIVEVTDFVEVPGLAFLVMELLDGESLRDLLKRRKGKWPPLRRVVSVMAQVCDALAAAHEKGVVHRDLKPDNVFVIKRAGGDYAKVLDFGIAKLKDQSDGGVGSTVTGVILGTPLYMSPEQATGKEVGPASDVWAAGVVMYEVLSGSVPFKAGNFVDLVQKIRTEPAPPLPLRTPRRERIPPQLAAVVMKCLEKSPSDRHRSMHALAEALRAALGLPGRALQIPWKLLAAAALLLAVGYGVWRSELFRKAKPIAGRVGTEVSEAARTAQNAVEDAVSATPEAPRPKPAARESAPPREPAAPREGAPPRPAAPSKDKRPEPAPAKQAKATHSAVVDLDVRSNPPGAKVVRLDTGELLGTTPVKLKFYQKPHQVALRLTLDGYEPARATASLKSSGKVSVTLRKTPRKRR